MGSQAMTRCSFPVNLGLTWFEIISQFGTDWPWLMREGREWTYKEWAEALRVHNPGQYIGTRK